MSSSENFLNYVLENLESLYSSVKYRKMFGQYCLYIENKAICFICDDQLFIKFTQSGQHYLDQNAISLTKDYIFKGSKLHFLASDIIENHDILHNLINQSLKDIKVIKRKK
ncbi:MAG: hypothetical protein RL208_696 [Pseudomonadota bacterium]|jgi:TfoX/Sxy family transcriptional regulator of competence genes